MTLKALTQKESQAEARKAVIYARVSTVVQTTKGHGIISQETRCREYAKGKGYEVVEVFADKAVSGSLIDRPGMSEMLAFLDANRDAGSFRVIIDDISRIARSISAHLALREAISATGAVLESPSVEFGEDSDSILVENLLASVSQHQRQKNAEQVRNRMRARMQNGYHTFFAPIGFKYEHVPGRGNMLTRDEPYASIIEEAMNGFASGRFASQAEVARFLESQPGFRKNRFGKVTKEDAKRILTRPLYAGLIQKAEWGIPLQEGQHDGLVSVETFDRIKQRLKETAYAPVRPDVSEAFVLRGSVACGCCGELLTSCFSKSKTGKRHPYYLCFNKACDMHRKSIRRDVIERDFDALLATMQPSRTLFDLLYRMMKKAWDMRLKTAGSMRKALDKEMATLKAQLSKLVDRLVETSSPSVVDALEGRIADLERQQLVLTEKRQNIGKPQGAFEEAFELAGTFLANPHKLWEKGDFTLRKTVLKLAFTRPIPYCRNEGFRTPEMALPFKALGAISGDASQMADRKGFEPSRRLQTAYSLSRGAPSTTRPPVRRRVCRRPTGFAR